MTGKKEQLDRERSKDDNRKKTMGNTVRYFFFPIKNTLQISDYKVNIYKKNCLHKVQNGH